MRNSSHGKADLEARTKGIEDLPILVQLLWRHWHLIPGLRPSQWWDKECKIRPTVTWGHDYFECLKQAQEAQLTGQVLRCCLCPRSVIWTTSLLNLYPVPSEIHRTWPPKELVLRNSALHGKVSFQHNKILALNPEKPSFPPSTSSMTCPLSKSKLSKTEIFHLVGLKYSPQEAIYNFTVISLQFK